MIKDGDLVVMYVRSEDNLADIMMKNTKEALYIKHATAMKKGLLVLGQELGGCRGSGSTVGRSPMVRRGTSVGCFYDGWTKYDSWM